MGLGEMDNHNEKSWTGESDANSFTSILIDGRRAISLRVACTKSRHDLSQLTSRHVWHCRRGDTPPLSALVRIVTLLRVITEPCCVCV